MLSSDFRYCKYTLSFETLAEDFDYSKINLSLYPVYHSYASKSLDYNIVMIDSDAAQGDVNFDNVLDILDVILLVSYILGNSDFNESQIAVSDVNGDGEINIVDIVHIITLILSF